MSRNIVLLSLYGALSLFAQQAPRGFVIDSHQDFDSKPGFERVAEICRPGHAMACVLPLHKDLGAPNKAVAAYPDVVIAYGHIQGDESRALSRIDDFAAAGARGIKLHSLRHNGEGPQYFPLYSRIGPDGMLLLFHTGIASHKRRQFTPMERMRPSHLDTLSRAFPGLNLQGAHLGNPWYDKATEATRWAPSLYFDLTGSTLKAKNLSLLREYLCCEDPQLHSSPDGVYAFEKMVLETDEDDPGNLDGVLVGCEAMLNACDVTEASRKKIYGETLGRILGIKPS